MTTECAFYVYKLINPITNQVFYVGKGKGDRAKQHTAKVRRSASSENREKDLVIETLLMVGLEPIIEYEATGLSESDAYSLEEHLIMIYGRTVDGGILTNICVSAKPPSHRGQIKGSLESRVGITKANEIKERMSRHRKGRTYEEIYGDELAAELKLKAAARAKQHQQEHPVWQKGREIPLDVRRRWSENRKGEGNNMYGRARPKEFKEHLSEHRKALNLTADRNYNAKTWKITSPTGEEYTITGTFDQFCAEHNISPWTMREIADGKFPKSPRSKCFGWKCERIVSDDRTPDLP